MPKRKCHIANYWKVVLSFVLKDFFRKSEENYFLQGISCFIYSLITCKINQYSHFDGLVKAKYFVNICIQNVFKHELLYVEHTVVVMEIG